MYAVAWYWSPDICGFLLCGKASSFLSDAALFGVLQSNKRYSWGTWQKWYGVNACDKGSTQLCLVPVTTRYSPACDTYMCVCGLVPTRYGLISVARAFVFSLSPTLLHRGAPREHLVCVRQQRVPKQHCYDFQLNTGAP